MLCLSANLKQFNSFGELNTYIYGKYESNANLFNDPNINLSTQNIMLFGLNVNNFMSIALPGIANKYWAAMPDFTLDLKEKHIIAILGSMNINKSDMSGLAVYNDLSKLLVISDKHYKSIELALLVIDKEEVPEWMNIIYETTK